jgi:hypothetical protein
LEKGIGWAAETVGDNSAQDNLIAGAKAALYSKADAVHTQLKRLNLKAETLEKEKITKLFYDIFNDEGINHQQTENITKPIASNQKK